jgi:alpha-D-xyloside xylohydrolase
VKAGSVVPLGPEISYAMEKSDKPMKIVVYEGANGSFDLYNDAGDNYDYEKGSFSFIPIQYNQSTKELKIGAVKGSYEAQQNDIEIHLWGEGKPLNINAKPLKIVRYEGNEVTVQL